MPRGKRSAAKWRRRRLRGMEHMSRVVTGLLSGGWREPDVAREMQAAGRLLVRTGDGPVPAGAYGLLLAVLDAAEHGYGVDRQELWTATCRRLAEVTYRVPAPPVEFERRRELDAAALALADAVSELFDGADSVEAMRAAHANVASRGGWLATSAGLALVVVVVEEAVAAAVGMVDRETLWGRVKQRLTDRLGGNDVNGC